MGRGKKCCCGGACCASAFTFDFEFLRQLGTGGTTTSVTEAGICDALNEEYQEGTSLDIISGTVRFTCGAGWSWDAAGSSAAYTGNTDLGASRPAYFYSPPPAYTSRCTDASCQVCDDTRVLSWVITNDNSTVADASLGFYTTLPGFFTSCPGLPSTPTNGLYRIVWIEVDFDADRATRETIDYTPWNGGSCPTDVDTTGAATSRTGTYRFAYIWDCSSECDEGTLVKAFTWEDLTFECVDLLPKDDTFTSGPTISEERCSSGDNTCGCTTGGLELEATRTTYAYLFDLTDATYSNWTLEP